MPCPFPGMDPIREARRSSRTSTIVTLHGGQHTTAVPREMREIDYARDAITQPLPTDKAAGAAGLIQ